MSKVKIDLDIAEKTISVKVDGEVVENIHDVVLYADNSMFGFGVEITSREDIGDMRKLTRIVAANTSKASDLLKRGLVQISAKFKDFVIGPHKHE